MILVTGASGFVGHAIMESCRDTMASPSLRNASYDDVKRIIEDSGADIIINTAAIADISECMADPDASYTANVQLPVFLAKASKGRKLVCFSSDQVYGGLDDYGPYTEERVKTTNIYAEHKLEMEHRVLDICSDAVILRAEWMYDYYLKKTNYFMNMKKAKGTVSFSSRNFRFHS